jgi:hypothetical protein
MSSLLRAFGAFVVVLAGCLIGPATASANITPVGAGATDTTKPYTYDAPARLSIAHATATEVRGSHARPLTVSWGTSVVADGVVDAANTAETAAGTNKIYSARVLNRAAEETGPYHNFPGSFDDVIFSEGTRTVNPNYFTKPRPNLGSDSIQYRLPGEINGRSGVYEIFTRPSVSRRTELVTHRFFRPDYQ